MWNSCRFINPCTKVAKTNRPITGEWRDANCPTHLSSLNPGFLSTDVLKAKARPAGLCARPLVEKVRHTRTHADATWEIDEFLNENQCLIVAEVELVSAEQAVELPPWIGPEVSHDPR